MDQPSPEQFLRACEAIAPLQLEIEHSDGRKLVRQTIATPFALVGRDERADIRLDKKCVSHRHAYLQMAAGHLWYVDLDSRTGTHGEDGSSAPAPLGLGQRLRIGPYTIRLAGGCRATDTEGAALANPMSSDSFDSSTRPRMSLEFLEGAAEQSSWVIDRVLTLVGRADHCTVRLHSPTVSRIHCALLHTPAGLWAIDLLGREGTQINGASVRWTLLKDADELGIGQFLIRVNQLDYPVQQTPNGSSLSIHEPPRSDLEGLLLAARQLAPTSSALALTSDESGSGSLLSPLVSQFALMQQHMFGQFQEALLTMARMFGDLHRDQLQLIEQEMDQLHELTRELQGLQLELARQSPARMEAGPADKPRTLSSLLPSAAAVPSDRRGIGPAKAAPAPMPPIRLRASAETAPVAKGPDVAPTSESPLRSHKEVHAWLNGRLAVLHEERQTRWQKILQVVAGK
jgi:pSer/pThr/pTyr-binding forkhead associated (FHA) protein